MSITSSLQGLRWAGAPGTGVDDRPVPTLAGTGTVGGATIRHRSITGDPDGTVTTRRAVFLVADTGGGHRSVAEAVAERFRRSDPGLSIDIVDPFLPTRRFRPGKVLDGYGLLVRYFPKAWERIYLSTDSPRNVRPVRALMSSVFGDHVRELVTAKDVVMVGCFHALTTDLLARAIRDLPASEAPRTFTLVCDPVDVHAAWIAEGIEATVFPSPESYQCATHLLTATEVRIVSGFPVRKEFVSFDPATDRREARMALGLPVDGPLVLVAGGGEGGGGMRRQVTELCSRLPRAHVVAVCGKNHRLLKKLQKVRTAFPDRLTVVGWSDQFAALVKASDVVVSKAGPNTITECVTAGVPLVLTSFIPGQEAGNARWAARIGACRWAPSVDEMCDAVRDLIDEGTSGRDQGRRPPATAADEIVQAVLGSLAAV